MVAKTWSLCGTEIPLSSTTLFGTVPKEDRLALFASGHTDYQKVVRLLDFSKRDVAKASSIPSISVRYDHKMPKELAERLQEWAIALTLVAQYFQDEHKTVLWFKTPNPLLGNITPRDMIRVGRFKKLQRFIQNALDENERPNSK
jgi:uncharacterized protein (DUF2384 family)